MNFGGKWFRVNHFGFTEEEYNTAKAPIQRRDLRMLRRLMHFYGYIMAGMSMASLVGIIPNKDFLKYLFFCLVILIFEIADALKKIKVSNKHWISRAIVFLILAGCVATISADTVFITMVFMIFVVIASELYLDTVVNYILMCLAVIITIFLISFYYGTSAEVLIKFFKTIGFIPIMVLINYMSQKDKISSYLRKNKSMEKQDTLNDEAIRAFFVEKEVDSEEIDDMEISYYKTAHVPEKVYDSRNESISESFTERQIEDNDVDEKYITLFKAPEAKILVVDDTEMNLTVVKGLLKNTLVSLDTCHNGYEALNLIQKVHYDCVLLDLMMPHLDGINTFRKIREISKGINKGVPCIILTASSGNSEREKYINEGFADVICKPLESEKLERVLVKFIPKDKLYLLGTSEYDNMENITNQNSEEGLLQKLTALEGIDLNIALENTGEASLLNVLLTKFRDDIEEKSNLIEECFSNKRWKEYINCIHTLKNTAELIGALELADRARKIEEAGNLGRMDRVIRENGPMIELYRSYYHKLEGFGQEKDIEESEKLKPEIDMSELNEILSAIKEFVNAHDYESAEVVMKELENYRYPEEFNSKYKELRRAFIKADIDKIHKIL